METENQELMDRILAAVDKLPPMPEVVFKAQKLLADSDSSPKELAAILETDQSIATRVLQMANSAFYGMSGRVSSIQHASLVLGYQNLSEIISVAGVRKSLQKRDGGWGLATLGNWKRSDDEEQDYESSDGYGTGFVIYVLRLAGVPADDVRIKKAIGWLKANQRASGRWFTRSAHKDSNYITNAGTALALLALAECGEADAFR